MRRHRSIEMTALVDEGGEEEPLPPSPVDKPDLLSAEERAAASPRRSFGVMLLGCLLVAVMVVALLLRRLPEESSMASGHSNNSSSGGSGLVPPVPDNTAAASAEMCWHTEPVGNRLYNATSAAQPGNTTFYVGGTILLSDGRSFANGVLEVTGGKLVSVRYLSNGSAVDVHGLLPPMQESAVRSGDVVSSAGSYVTAGLVDMHNHGGVYSFPVDLAATQDGNEETNAVFPQLRSIDGIDPEDRAYDGMLSGGVTTVQTLPGSGNVMGGQAFQLKLRGKRVEDMLISEAEGGVLALKMACGENPKHTYGPRHNTPMSRMGSAWLMRDRFYAAARLLADSDNACPGSDLPVREDTLKLQPLVRLLRGTARLHVHCYKVLDMEMVIRLSHEFGFNITAFHHAADGYKIADILRREGIGVASFADLWGYKYEAYDGSTQQTTLLTEAGVKTALKSDHPVLNSRYLLHEAGKAHYYGMPAHHALAAVTSVPAELIGLQHKLGSLRAGLDADFVVWDRHPLRLAAKPTRVVIDGRTVFRRSQPASILPGTATDGPHELAYDGSAPCSGSHSALFIANGRLWLPEASQWTSADASVYVVDGNIQCLGSSCVYPGGDCAFFNASGGYITPGLIESMSSIGLLEIGQENSAGDGYIHGSPSQLVELRAVDGVRMGTRHTRSAWRAGVLTTVSAPLGHRLVRGQSVAFHTLGELLDDALLLSSAAALHATVSDRARTDHDLRSSISGQILMLRQMLAKNDESTPSIQNVIDGTIPLVVSADQKDIILALVRLKADFPALKMVIEGGAEAWMVAAQLAAANVGVILRSRTPNSRFETAHVRDDAAALLHAAGVKLGLAVEHHDNSRWLRWEAGFAVDGGLPYAAAMAAITSNIADMYGLPDGVGRLTATKAANFVVWNGEPLTFDGRPALVVVGEQARCNPRQA
eukprot:PLAT6334.1.p1 GENE.PLAT6334.1~~PLAT6334.1.p1  ORF type:complete len:934 (-),score=314.09 PLAT6334.1:1638-4439(-)